MKYTYFVAYTVNFSLDKHFTENTVAIIPFKIEHRKQIRKIEDAIKQQLQLEKGTVSVINFQLIKTNEE